MGDKRTEKTYARELERRAARAAKNAEEGRTLGNMAPKGIPLHDKVKAPAGTLSDVIDEMTSKHRLENTVKTADGFDPRIDANVRNNPLKNSKGFSRLLPMLGLGGAALAASSIFNKAKAGDIPNAALESADLATDYVPGVSQVKAIAQSLKPDVANEGEDEALAQLKQDQIAAQSPEERRFSKIRQLMGR